MKDGALAYKLLAEKMLEDSSIWGESYNFSTESQTTVLELVEKITTLMGSSLKPEVLNQASNEIRNQYLSAAKAKRQLGWKPGYTLESSLEETIKWYTALLSAKR